MCIGSVVPSPTSTSFSGLTLNLAQLEEHWFLKCIVRRALVFKMYFKGPMFEPSFEHTLILLHWCLTK